MTLARCLPGMLIGAAFVLGVDAAAQTKPPETSSGTVRHFLLMPGSSSGELAPESAHGEGASKPVAAATTPRELTPEEYTNAIAAGQEPRSYWLHLPAGDDGKSPLPLVFVLHPRGGTGPRLERMTGWSVKADREKFVVVYPDAEGNPRTWNAGYLTGRNVDDDIEFLQTLLDVIPKHRAIDPKRIYVCGLGGGAMMAYWIGALLSDRFAAIGSVSGAVGVRRDNGEVATIPAPSPISVISFHGQHNSVVRYKGGSSRSSERNFLSIVDAKNFWQAANGCEAEPDFQGVVMNRSPSGGLPTQAEAKADIFDTEAPQKVKVFREVYSRCEGGVEVVFYGLVEGNHKWPGGRELLRRTQVSSRDIKATDFMWEFFAKHPRP